MAKIDEIRERAESAKKNHDYLAGLDPQTIVNLCDAMEFAKMIIKLNQSKEFVEHKFSRIDQILERGK